MSGSAGQRRWLSRIALATGVLAVFGYAWANRVDYGPLDLGSEAPAYDGYDLQGRPLGLSDLRGQVVLLNVWATWCRPCIKEMPALQRLYEAHRGDGFTIVAVSVDNANLVMGDPAEAVRRFVVEYGITFPIVLDPENRIENVYHVTGLPMTYLIGRDGRIRGKMLGARDWDEPQFEAEIRNLLEN